MTDVALDGKSRSAPSSTVAEEAVAELPSAPVGPAESAAVADVPAPEEVTTLGRWQTLLVAVGLLLVLYGVALGSMYALGSLVHVLDPRHHFDILYVFHNRIVVLALIAVAVLWLLPPYPPAIRSLQLRTAGQPPGPDDPGIDVPPPEGPALASSEPSGTDRDQDAEKGGTPTEHT